MIINVLWNPEDIYNLNPQAQLLRLCKQGDEKAQRLLYAQMKSKWMGLAIRYMKDSDVAKDVFQDAALKIFTDLPYLNDENAFGGWAKRIFINTALNYLRQQQGYLEKLQSHFEDKGPSLEKGDENIILNMDNEWLLGIINEMPEGYRMVFNLFIIDGYSHKEISDRLNISESTSRSQLTKAKQYMKWILEKINKNEHERAVGY